MNTHHRSRLRAGLAVGSVAPLLGLAIASSSAMAIDHAPTTGYAPVAVSTGTAAELAAAMASPSVTVTGARFQTQADPVTAGVGDTALTGFPTDGSTFAILSNGDVADIPLPGTYAGTDLGGPPVRGVEFDVTILEVDLDVPTGSNCLAFDARFLTEDHWITYGSQDAFIAELDTSTWTTSLMDTPPFLPLVTAPNNFADAPDGLPNAGNPIMPGRWIELGWSAANGAGTAFDGGSVTSANFGVATDLLVVQTPITAGEHTVHFSIFDTVADDSVVFLDNLRLAQVANPAADCSAGARAVTHALDLSPDSGTSQVGAEHTVTATVTDAAGAPTAVGTPVEFTVTGANASTATDTTDVDGTATLTYTGATVGTDTIRACVRPSTDGPCAALDDVTFTWTAAPPPPAVAFSSATYAVSEAGPTATITATLSATGSAAVTVDYATTDGTATAGSDYTAATGTLTFAAGDTSASFTVPITDDTDDEPDETVLLSLTNPVGATLGTPASATLTITDNDQGAAEEAERIFGIDRFGTAAAISAAWAPGVDVVYLTSGLTYPDAMPAGALGGLHDSPVLLTRPDSLPDATKAELTRLAPQRIVVLGGPAAVTEPLIEELRGYAQADTADEVTRLAGPDRYATAAAAAMTYPTGVQVAFVAAGTDFPDAIAGASRAGALDAPVLLTRPGDLPASTAAALTHLNPANIVVLGGPGAVSDTVLTALGDFTDGTVTRVAGPDRYGTAAAIAGAHAPGVAAVFIASGAEYADALAGAPLIAALDSPILLTRQASLPTATIAELERLNPAQIIVLGGDETISEAVRTALRSYIG
ncbi:cell wall-binding repeat-containing protein [Ornithinimicrobium cryptoxanthini]|uniref:Cell wall-binding repeat-containing protein n=1 Tax=Ornithinimicrobium cryptoxanthini TaxID=2934161 RepID=A0ABY4YJ94_9MICO|nr:cell wall-binding repeat-containing protein [Ornithinimicrobium cryptoxanthini]USQ76697.1 cell wall-binding repeat-containing protein [Ornithinimicrobium cryptoxanthini]